MIFFRRGVRTFVCANGIPPINPNPTDSEYINRYSVNELFEDNRKTSSTFVNIRIKCRLLLKLEPKHDYNGALPAQWRTMNAHKIHYNNNIIFYTRVPPLNTQINTTIKKGFSHELHWLWVQAKSPHHHHPVYIQPYLTLPICRNIGGWWWRRWWIVVVAVGAAGLSVKIYGEG